MDPRLLSVASRKQFAKAANAASAMVYRSGNYGVDDIATLQGIPDFYG